MKARKKSLYIIPVASVMILAGCAHGSIGALELTVHPKFHLALPVRGWQTATR